MNTFKIVLGIVMMLVGGLSLYFSLKNRTDSKCIICQDKTNDLYKGKCQNCYDLEKKE
jgi:hypothetical protein